MKYSNTWLLQQLADGKNFDFLYFWGHQPRKDGLIGKSCLSQWFATGFTHEGTHYPTAEHWMMVHKALTFADHTTAAAILADPDPRAAKAFGRQITGYDNKHWYKVKYEVVKQGNVLKFSQNESLNTYLRSTGDAILVETSPYDTMWGIGMKAQEAASVTPHEWRGENWLGWCLMEARDLV